jgi:(1->4)-alpha-D-glucan 1-alpha-D-glucosylmutase
MPAAPLATYRLQLTKDFGFDDAASLAPYLAALGITHLYASPFLKARPGSTHGYDIIDHERLNPELGGEEGFARLSAALKLNGLGLILDFVPNHMGVGRADNAWWLDVLEWGQKSPYAIAFDIDWDALPHRRHPGVLIPILGRPYGDALQAGEIALKYDAETGSFAAWYFEHKLPINPQRYGEMLRGVVATADAETAPVGRALLAVADDYRDPASPDYRDAADLKKKLREIDGAATVIERGLAAYSHDCEAGRAAMHRLLERQHFRLAYWRVAFSAVNYRRFFDINELAGLRIEHPATFRAVHGLVARLIADGSLQGLRIDHIDGLRDPAQYTRRLRQLIRKAGGGGQSGAPFHVTVEKILADGESMPALPGIAGTTGYEWLNTISRVLVNASGRDKLDALWRDIDPAHGEFGAVLRQSKRRVLDTILASEFNVLVQLLSRIAAGHFTTRDYVQDRLREALRLYVIAFPIYRTYIAAAGPSERDRAVIDGTVAAARACWQGTDADIFDFLRTALMLDLARSDRPYSQPRLRQFALKMQQFTGPLAAKSLEDTAFYRYHALLALNEVGGDPTLPALSVVDFHRRMTQRASHAPLGLTATATHDTKRGEDARTRILSLSEIPGLWTEHVSLWRRLNAHLVRTIDGRRCPSAGHEYLVYQTLIGAWPHEPIDDIFVRRIEGYAVKAAREAKLETSWLVPNEPYEQGLRDFVHGILGGGQSQTFTDSFTAIARRTALLGALNSLSQLILKATMPGIPDFYQGTEGWDLSLVDPDNRNPVDFAKRAAALASTLNMDWRKLAEHWPDGRIKVALTCRLLALRARYPEVFSHGAYTPVETFGRDSDHLIAYTRSTPRTCVLIVTGRHFGRISSEGQHWPNVDLDVRVQLDREYASVTPLGFGTLVREDSFVSGRIGHLPLAIVSLN